MIITTHAQRLERWLGAAQVESISEQMRDWSGPPVPVANVPGVVYARRGGEFVGAIRGGYFAGLADFYHDRVRRIARGYARQQRAKMHTGFSSLSDLISEATTGGKMQQIPFSKIGAGAAIHNRTLWTETGFPGTGGTPASRPGGTNHVNTDAGGLQQVDPNGTDTLHLTTLQCFASTAPNVLVLYDRLFAASSVAHTNNASQTVTGTPARYNATTSAPGTFFFLEVTSTLGATAHTVLINYTDNNNNAAQNSPATTVVVSSTAGRCPHAQFFTPLDPADTGILAITALTFSAVSSGTSNAVLGHALSLIPQPVANVGVVLDGINSAFNLVEVKTDACLALLELKGVASASTYTGSVILVAG
jgi:hypothetical protein